MFTLKNLFHIGFLIALAGVSLTAVQGQNGPVERAEAERDSLLRRADQRSGDSGFDERDDAQEKAIEAAEINECMSAAQEQQLESFYVEILAKPVRRTKKVEPED